MKYILEVEIRDEEVEDIQVYSGDMPGEDILKKIHEYLACYCECSCNCALEGYLVAVDTVGEWKVSPRA